MSGMDSIWGWLASSFDFTLNLLGLLLWLYWRALGFRSSRRPPLLSLAATLQYAGEPPGGRAGFLLGLVVLLAGRSLVYWNIGSAVGWMPTLQMGVVGLTFRSDYLGRMALFSVCSFGRLVVVFYLWLLLLSAVNRKVTDPWQDRVRQHLGWLERGPFLLKLLSPMVVGTLLWAGLSLVFARWGLLPVPNSRAHLGQQALVEGASAFLAWRTLIVAVLALHLLNAYVFLGNFPLWNFVNTTAGNLLRPLAWLPLRLGRVDLTPAAAIVLVILLAEVAARELRELFLRLPL